MQNDCQYPLYDPRFEHDACGIGAVISIRGVQSHRTVDDALKIVEKLQHRAGRDASGETGDGVGLMMQIPHRLMCKAARAAGLPELGAPRSYGVVYAMDFLPAAVERQQLSLSPDVPSAEGKNVIVVGTGNTASDCVATSLRQGCASVRQLVRRPREDYLLPDGSLPRDYAQEECEALFGEDPRLFSQSVAALEKDERGALCAVVTRDGTRLPCELLIAATGFAGCREDVCTAFGVACERTVKTEAGGYQTDVPHVFAAGDMRRGQSLVVHAIAEGRACAAEVDRFLMGYTNLL